MEKAGKVGTYIRPSTERQDDQHQRDSITRYIDEHDLPQDRVEQYVDIESDRTTSANNSTPSLTLSETTSSIT